MPQSTLVNNTRVFAVTTVLTVVGALAIPGLTQADPLPFGPDTCIQGYVWREARAGDTVCVTTDVRDRVAQENANPGANREPGGGDTCVSGFVWREAFDGDTICVTPEIRADTLADNAAVESRKQANQPQSTTAVQTTPAPSRPADRLTFVFEAFGTPGAEEIRIVVNGVDEVVLQDVPLPYRKVLTVEPDTPWVQMKVWGPGNSRVGCQMFVDEQFIKENTADSNIAFCDWTNS